MDNADPIGFDMNERAPAAAASPILEGRGSITTLLENDPWFHGGLSDTELRLRRNERPALTKTTVQAVRESTRKHTVDGREFFVSATDENVLVPVSGRYDNPRITQLPQDERGWYFLDPEGWRFPVDSRPNVGHMPGHEWHRIRESAKKDIRDFHRTRGREGKDWTWDELVAHVNQPRFYRIEDAPGNQSHRHELARES
ncbi:GH-E family nuclease [Nocardia sp. NPDC049190]|uniref:GH-E family nuclease n=1 Tax=Nocardia sp. NPDC049190 TaxID=3155650 RepID=UPI0033F2A033